MKKLLLMIGMLALSITSSYAQIKVKKTFDNNLIIIGNITGGSAANILGALNGQPTKRVAEHRLYCRILGEKTTYGILVNTENRFDDDFEFALGTDIEKAKESLNAILGFMNDSPLKTSIVVEDEDERTIQINLLKRNIITLRAIDAQGAVIVNDVHLQRNNLERALKLLTNKAARKVAEATGKADKWGMDDDIYDEY